MLCVINLDGTGKPLNVNVVSVGGTTSVLCEGGNVFKSALLSNAAYVIVLHNHPSGDVTPSMTDITLTRQLISGGKLLSIPVLDHVVIGAKRNGAISYYSMNEHNDCEFQKISPQQMAAERQPLRKSVSR